MRGPMRIALDFQLAATIVALLMNSSHACTQESQRRLNPESQSSEHKVEIGKRNRHADWLIPFAGQGKKDPRSARDYFERGLARTDAGDSSGAIEDFTNAIALNSNMQAPKRAKKSELDNRGQRGPHEKLVVIDKFNALAYFNIGTLLMRQGHLSEAIDNFNKSIRIHPRFSRAFNNRGYVKHLMGDIDGATKDYDRSVQLDPKNSNAYYNRAVFRYKIQDLAGAIADYTRAIEIDPQNAAVFHDRGCAYLHLAKLDEAHRDFDRAIELDPEAFVAYGNRGLVRILQGRDAEAEADLAHYLQHAGDNKDTLEVLVRKARESRRANGVKPSGNLPVIAP